MAQCTCIHSLFDSGLDTCMSCVWQEETKARDEARRESHAREGKTACAVILGVKFSALRMQRRQLGRVCALRCVALRCVALRCVALRFGSVWATVS